MTSSYQIVLSPRLANLISRTRAGRGSENGPTVEEIARLAVSDESERESCTAYLDRLYGADVRRAALQTALREEVR